MKNDDLFKLECFHETILRQEFCATTRNRDKTRIRLMVCVEPTKDNLFYEVYAVAINESSASKSFTQFGCALDYFNALRH